MSFLPQWFKSLFTPVKYNPHQGAINFAYRPDIDGLRALAVLCVVAFHAFPATLQGGFIGVDIFFVISGYLISSIIMQDLEQGTFSIVNFYNRRIRRIFPALILVFAAVMAFGWFALLPDENKALGKHVFGGAAFISNFLLWREAGYFDVASQLKPLLHLWSLGIEEQFYIVFPLILWLCVKYRFRIPTTVAVLCALSFLDNMYLFCNAPAGDFYSPLSRVWELMAGALLSSALRYQSAQHYYLRVDAVCSRWMCVRGTPNDGRSLSLVLATCGIIFVAVGLLLSREGEAYPGWKALLPVLGAVCLLAAGPANGISKYVFSNRIAVFIGLISYPLYLWHWPLLSYAHIIIGDLDSSTRLLRVGLVVFACILAIVTYLGVERPLRFHRNRGGKISLILLIIMVCYGIIGYFMCTQKNINVDTMPILHKRINEKSKYTKKCIEFYPDWEEFNSSVCITQSEFSKVTIAVIGDSHAEHLFPGILGIIDDKNSVALFAASGAAPYIDIASLTNNLRNFRSNGYKLINRSFDILVKNKNIKNVVLAHNPSCSYDDIIDLQNKELKDRKIILINGMKRTFDLLDKLSKNVIIILDNPHLPFHPSRCIKRPYEKNKNKKCQFDRSIFDDDLSIQWYKDILYEVIKDYSNIKIIDLSKLFCDNTTCFAKKDELFFYIDKNHLSIDGSLFVAPAILNKIE